MDNHTRVRWWHGPDDPVHPLSRIGHVCVAHGRYIYVVHGCAQPCGDETVYLFDRAGLARLDTLTSSVHFLPIHWDYASLQKHGSNPLLCVTSGSAATVEPATVNNAARIYVFAGFSLLQSFHTNLLTRIDLLPFHSMSRPVAENPLVQFQPPCCHATIISGHGLLGYLLGFWRVDGIVESVLYTTLRGLQRRLRCLERCGRISTCSSALPSPRDKLSMEYWRGRLYAFGGYGPKLSPPMFWPNRVIMWPYLYDADDPNEWVLCEQNGGWNNQLLIYDIAKNRWSAVNRRQTIGSPPSARAAHQSTLFNDRGWLFIFGGRGPATNQLSTSAERSGSSPDEQQEAGRLNDLYCLNLWLMEWTRVLTPLDFPDIERPIWPCGRSWMGMVSLDCSPGRLTGSPCIASVPSHNHSAFTHGALNLFITGGLSNANEALADAHLLRVSRCSVHGKLEAIVVADSERSIESQGNLRAFSAPSLRVINGFHCISEPNFRDGAVLRIVQRNGRTVLATDQPASRIFYSSQSPFINSDITALLATYNGPSLSPQDTLDNSIPDPTRCFFQIAKTHAELIVFLICEFCLYDVCTHRKDQQHETLDSVECCEMIDEICVHLLSHVHLEVHLLAFFVRTFLNFMLPWDPILMVLRETGGWVPRTVQRTMLDHIASEYAASTNEIVEIKISSQRVFDKLAILLPVYEIQVPPPFQAHAANANEHLSNYVRQTISSFLSWSSRSPLDGSVRDLSLLSTTTPTFSMNVRDQTARYWHTTTASIDGGVYVIGGSTVGAVDAPVEYYRPTGPLSLTNACVRRLCDRILAHFTNGPESKRPMFPNISVSNGSHRCVQYQHFVDSNCPCSICSHYCTAVNRSIEHILAEWLK